MSIELSKEQQVVFNRTLSLCLEIEKTMLTVIEPSDPQQIQQALSDRIPYLANTSTMMEAATAISDWSRGQVAIIAMGNQNILDLSAALQREWVKGQLARWSAFYERVDTLVKSLKLSIEGLRSMLSYEKELANQNRFTNEK